MKKRLMIALCCVVLLLNILPIIPMAEAVEFWDVDENLYYCRAQLGDLPNGKALLYAYDSIVAGIDACAEEILFDNDKYPLSVDEFKLALEAVRRDHTEQFWLHTEYSYFKNDNGSIAKMIPQYLFVGEELEDAKVAFNQAINNFLSRLTPGMSEYEIEKTLHDLLAIKVYYTESQNAHNAYGALVEGKAVCEGYAEALQCLLQRVGIQSVQVYGYGINPTTGGKENHAWNIVRLDGEYYLVDLTWNDQDTWLSYGYFNQTSAFFEQDHKQWKVGAHVNEYGQLEYLSCKVFDLPECTNTDQTYFVKNNLVIDSYTVDSIAKLLKDNNFAVGISINGDVNVFDAWFRENISSIAGAAGVSSGTNIGFNCFLLGCETYIYIDACAHKTTMVNAKPATCEESGVKAHRECVKCKKLFLVELDQNGKLVEIFTRESVIIVPLGHTLTIKVKSENTLNKKAEKCTEHDTYFLTCSVCGEISDTYTFKDDVIGEHAYSNTWVADGALKHKRVCANGCGIDITEAHADKDDVAGCDVCGYTFSVADLLPNIDGGEVAGDVIGVILANPLVLFGGSGSILLVIALVVLKKLKG